LQELKQQEQEENKTKLGMAKEDFMKMLEEHKISNSDIKFWKVQSYLVTDPRWKAIPDEKERENLFQDYLDRLYKQE
jgi:pre-mRNA-processing factor 40